MEESDDSEEDISIKMSSTESLDESSSSVNSDESYYDENDDYFVYQPNYSQLLAQKEDLFRVKKNLNYSIDFTVNNRTQKD